MTVKLEAFPFTRYDTLEGKLASISRDAIQDEAGSGLRGTVDGAATAQRQHNQGDVGACRDRGDSNRYTAGDQLSAQSAGTGGE